MYRCGFVLVTLLIPYPSVQHFIWPLHWCLLADICNHTWIPECGEEDEQAYTRRLFIDECDMYEYNCDYERDYEMVNYSDCFLPATGCPTVQPCPSIPTCPDHRYHRIGQRFFSPARRMVQTHTRTRRPKTTPSLPMYMLKGKRRYTPKPKKRRHTTRSNDVKKIAKTTPTSLRTVVLRKETIVKDGRTFVKVIKGVVKRKSALLKGFDANDFLEK